VLRLRSAQKRFYSRLNHVVEPLARNAVTGPLPIGAGLVALETIGRRSGMTRSRPVVALRFGSAVLTATVRPSSDWIANLRATPQSTVWVMGEPVPARAQITKLPIGSVALLRLG